MIDQSTSGELLDTKEEFSLVKRAKSFTHAGRGVVVFIKTTHNAWIHLILAAVAVFLGIFFSITTTEWLFIILAAGFVLVTEAINTAIEIDIDLTSPEYHPYAKDTKDVAAGAVLIAALTAFLIGFMIFTPYVLTLIR